MSAFTLSPLTVPAFAGKLRPTSVTDRQNLIEGVLHSLDLGDPFLLALDDKLKEVGENGLDYATLLRWLVARKWNIAHAIRDLAAHAAYRELHIPNGRVPQVSGDDSRYHMLDPSWQIVSESDVDENDFYPLEM